MLICCNSGLNSNLYDDEVYQILDTDDYKVESIRGFKLLKLVSNHVIEVENIVQVSGSSGYFIKLHSLFKGGYNEVQENFVINIGSYSIDVWYKGKLVSFKVINTCNDSMNLEYSYWYKVDEGIKIVLGSGGFRFEIMMCGFITDCFYSRGMKLVKDKVMDCSKKADIKKMLLFR